MSRNETDIMFVEKTTFEGKNGIEKAKGLKIVTTNDGIFLHPITLKDTVGSACISISSIDLTAIDKVINTLIIAKDNILADQKSLRKVVHESYNELNPTDSHDGY